jgi:hypothetical protein
MVGVPALVMLLSYTVILDRLFTFTTAADKMVWAGPCRAVPSRKVVADGGSHRVAHLSPCAGVAALCAVQCVIIGFLVSAFSETDEPADEGAEKKAQ